MRPVKNGFGVFNDIADKDVKGVVWKKSDNLCNDPDKEVRSVYRMVIQRNMQACNANRQLNMVEKAKEKSSEKLSSGYKVNRSADDAAGLSISEKMRRQIRGLTRAGENVEDGISLCQVIDGAMSEMHDMVNRMNELSIQAANGTNSESDREDIQMEIDGIVTEFGRIIETTKFNELYVFKDDLTWSDGGNGKKVEEAADPIQKISRDFRDIDGVKVWKGSQLSDYFFVDLRSPKPDWTVLGDNPDLSKPECAWIDFDGFKASSEGDLIKQLDQRGFDSSCCHCNTLFYGIKFVSELDNDKLKLTAGNVDFNYHMVKNSKNQTTEVLKIDLKDIWSRYQNQAGKKIGQVICETLVDVIQKGGKQPGSNLTRHLTSYAYQKDTAKLYLLNNWISAAGYNHSEFSTMPRDDQGHVEINKPIIIMPSRPKKKNRPRVKSFDKKRQIFIQAGADGVNNNKIRINLPTMTLETLGLNGLSVLMEEQATDTINILTKVQKLISEDRSRIGAYQNRLEHTARNLENVIENTNASESRIRDTDMADEMVRYAGKNILAQSGQSMLNQSNTRSQRVLRLLGV